MRSRPGSMLPQSCLCSAEGLSAAPAPPSCRDSWRGQGTQSQTDLRPKPHPWLVRFLVFSSRRLFFAKTDLSNLGVNEMSCVKCLVQSVRSEWQEEGEVGGRMIVNHGEWGTWSPPHGSHWNFK